MTRRPAPTAPASPRPGRPPKSPEQSEAMRARVVEVARRLFAEEGFEAVSMRRIAAASGCAPMTLYGYFHSKNEILRHIWEGFFEELFAQIDAATRRGTAAVRLRRACKVYLRYWLQHPERYRMVYLNEDRTAPGERYYVEASAVTERYGRFRELIEGAQAEGSGRAGDAQQIGEALICGLQGIAHCLITIPEYPWMAVERLLQPMLGIALGPEV